MLSLSPWLIMTYSTLPAASSSVDKPLRLHGWHIAPLLMDIIVFTDRPPRPLSTSVLAYTVGWSHHRCWASTPSSLAAVITADRFLRLHGWCNPLPLLMATMSSLPAAAIAADWCFYWD
uniref:HGWP repeat containing protein-like n=1 Tax=Oryza sativa subsp. japonica TaxID=39947 RepID=Q2QUM3_ORYSJ|nr:hypothetical protein LOC_Os12g15770 [Oryza sativa Japonica Group]